MNMIREKTVLTAGGLRERELIEYRVK